jgi:hypothetical protein
MPWSQEQERLTQQARLQIASPEEVYRELQEMTNKPRGELTVGDAAEAEALLCNPSVADQLLVDLYAHTGTCANIEDERWCNLVYFSRKNERIGTEEEYPDSPDMEHYRIHKAIFRLLEIAPLELRWLYVLYGLLDELNFRQVHSPDAVEPVLTRWAQLDDKNSQGETDEGYFTSVSLRDEFRCLVASLYGRTRIGVQGSPTAKDVAVRAPTTEMQS